MVKIITQIIIVIILLIACSWGAIYEWTEYKKNKAIIEYTHKGE